MVSAVSKFKIIFVSCTYKWQKYLEIIHWNIMLLQGRELYLPCFGKGFYQKIFAQ
jgi:hypothetical protein